MYDAFYPHSDTMSRNNGAGMWQVHMILKLEGHLRNARNGDRDAESKLCNRLGQLRRNVPFYLLSEDLQGQVKAAVEFLRSTGRKVDFRAGNPANWITQRDGSPRW